MQSLLSPLVRLLGSSSGTGSTSRSEPWITNEENSTESTSCGPMLSASGQQNLSLSIASLPETRRLVVTQALDQLFTNRFFDICELDSVLKIVGKRKGVEAYNLLRALHCVHYDKMNPALRDRIPQLVNECLNPQAVQCVATDVALQGVEL